MTIPLHEHVIAYLVNDDGTTRTMEALELDIIRAAILRHEGNVAEAARALNLGRSTIYRKLALAGGA